MSDEAKCGNCKHWNRENLGWRFSVRLKPLPGEDPYGDEIDERQRAAEALFGECKTINLLENQYEGYDTAADLPLAGTLDASNYMATLYTQAEFGCALWADAAPEQSGEVTP